LRIYILEFADSCSAALLNYAGFLLQLNDLRNQFMNYLTTLWNLHMHRTFSKKLVYVFLQRE